MEYDIMSLGILSCIILKIGAVTKTANFLLEKGKA